MSKLDVGKVKAVSIDLKNLSDVVDNYVVKKTFYNKLDSKVTRLTRISAKKLIH